MSTPAQSATVLPLVPRIPLVSAGNVGTSGTAFGSGGGRGGGSLDAETQRFIEAKVETVKAQNDARFAEVLAEIRSIKPGATWQQMAAVVFAGVTFIFAILAYASDRFDGGLAADAIKDQVTIEQVKRDSAQDQKLDTILEAVAKLKPTTAP